MAHLHTWKSCGVDDMVLLQRVTVAGIAENLKKRYKENYLYLHWTGVDLNEPFPATKDFY